jgi:hypothetical protein
MHSPILSLATASVAQAACVIVQYAGRPRLAPRPVGFDDSSIIAQSPALRSVPIVNVLIDLILG